MEWLSHSHKKHCELCKTPFRFTKLYDADMPQVLPWTVFVQRACLHVAFMILRACRALLVSAVWLLLLPWLIRWSWRWMFWVADVGWARESFVRQMQIERLLQLQNINSTMDLPQTAQVESLKYWESKFGKIKGDTALKASAWILAQLGKDSDAPMDSLNSTIFGPVSVSWPQADSSILSGFSYLSELTKNSGLNRIILDVFEGQLITCVVITGFVLVFLIREWVVQQQPLVNLDNLNIEVQARQRQERRARDRMRRQLDLLDQARAQANALENELAAAQESIAAAEAARPAESVASEEHETIDLENVEDLVNAVSAKYHDLDGRAAFAADAIKLIRDIHFTEGAEPDGRPLVAGQKAIDAILKLPLEQRLAWIEVLSDEAGSGITAGWSRIRSPQGDEDSVDGQSSGDLSPSEESSGSRRPPMPSRDTSSRATHIQRTLEELEPDDQIPVFNGRALPSIDTADHHAVRFADLPATPRPTDYLDVQSPLEMLSRTSTATSWQEITMANVNGNRAEGAPAIEEMPVTNAGPDAKINIKRGGKNNWTSIPEPMDEPALITGSELRRRLGQISDDSFEAAERSDARLEEEYGPHTNNPFHPDGPDPDNRDRDTFRDRVESVFREEFGLDEAEHLHEHEPAAAEAAPADEGADAASEHSAETTVPVPQPPAAPPSFLQRTANWFWGDIQLLERGPDPVPVPQEERIDPAEPLVEIPDVPDANADIFFGGGQAAAAAAAPQPPAPGAEVPEHDPEVVAAAQQAGLDPEAIEDVDDLEGIFELIGLHGPIIGLFQTSCFCSVLVSATIAGAVGLPYLWGKVVLSFIGNPLGFILRVPLQTASIAADFLIDAFLFIGGWLVVLATFVAGIILSPISSVAKSAFMGRVSDFGLTTAEHALTRVEKLLFASESSIELNWNSAFLKWSIHAHDSLVTIQDEVNFVLNYIGSVITSVVDTISSGSMALVWQRSVNAMAHVLEFPARLLAGVEALEQYTRPFFDIIRNLRTGALTFRVSEVSLEPTLVYWNSTDRGLAVMTGYVALAALAAIYVALDTPIMRTESGQKTEKIVRDTLRQAGGVLKVILIISIEMLVFPLYCGLLLDLAFLPLFQGASMATRWAFAVRAPYTFCFVHWFIGTCYMFHFALFVGMCRKILRKGVLWFIRDPDDPTFHPVRDVLERNVTTQLRKIVFSALVYGALVILCLGGVIWSIGHIFEGIFPIQWISTEPVLEFPMDLLLYNFLTPLLIKLFKPSDAVHAMYAWWLRRCARALRLSHFLFDDRRKDEEGRHVHKSWITRLLLQRGNVDAALPEDHHLDAHDESTPDVYFQRDGKYVLTPCSDQYRPPKPGEAFLYATDNDAYIADKDGNKNDHFSRVYIPPSFQLRVTLFMVCLWMFSAFTGLCATLVPLVFGRHLFGLFVPAGVQVNDIYAYSVGAYIIFGALYAGYKYNSAIRYLQDNAFIVDVKAWLSSVARNVTQALKCLYVYGFLGVVLPIAFALIIQFYLILPIHTLLVASASTLASSQSAAAQSLDNNNSTLFSSVATNATELLVQYTSSALNNTLTSQQTPSHPVFVDHSMHVLADYALGLLYVRIAIRFILSTPTSRAAEAFRRITANGYLDPDARLATRFFVLPATILALVVLVAPLTVAHTLIVVINLFRRNALATRTQAVIYRYAYPLMAINIVLWIVLRSAANATARWRARIRDEVYLVGERLHNFGEKRPPVGSRSVVRKDR
jgi:E3 ubiquitin-protein ligase MARCH6